MIDDQTCALLRAELRAEMTADLSRRDAAILEHAAALVDGVAERQRTHKGEWQAEMKALTARLTDHFQEYAGHRACVSTLKRDLTRLDDATERLTRMAWGVLLVMLAAIFSLLKDVVLR